MGLRQLAEEMQPSTEEAREIWEREKEQLRLDAERKEALAARGQRANSKSVSFEMRHDGYGRVSRRQGASVSSSGVARDGSPGPVMRSVHPGIPPDHHEHGEHADHHFLARGLHRSKSKELERRDMLAQASRDRYDAELQRLEGKGSNTGKMREMRGKSDGRKNDKTGKTDGRADGRDGEKTKKKKKKASKKKKSKESSSDDDAEVDLDDPEDPPEDDSDDVLTEEEPPSQPASRAAGPRKSMVYQDAPTVSADIQKHLSGTVNKIDSILDKHHGAGGGVPVRKGFGKSGKGVGKVAGVAGRPLFGQSGSGGGTKDTLGDSSGYRISHDELPERVRKIRYDRG